MQTLLDKHLNNLRRNVNEITSDELIKKINNKENIVICDVRSLDAWQEGHLPNAIHCDRGMLELNIEKLIPDVSQEVIIYCGGGTRSCLSTDSLNQMGYKNVSSLIGGFKNWQSEKLPIT